MILIDRLGPDIFLTLQMKGHVLHCARAHLKVPGSSLVWNTLLTKKLPMFLSRLNEINVIYMKYCTKRKSIYEARKTQECSNCVIFTMSE